METLFTIVLSIIILAITTYPDFSPGQKHILMLIGLILPIIDLLCHPLLLFISFCLPSSLVLFSFVVPLRLLISLFGYLVVLFVWLFSATR